MPDQEPRRTAAFGERPTATVGRHRPPRSGRRRGTTPWAGVGLVLAALLVPSGATPAGASPAASAVPSLASAAVHEVPADVAVQAYVRPRNGVLTLLVRVPLESMRDVELPLRDGGRYLDLSDPGLEGLLRDATALWIADYLRFWEDGEPLGEERVVAVRLSLPSDRSFVGFDEALAHIQEGAPLSPAVELPPAQAHLDALLEVPITSAEARFSVDPRLAHLGLETVSVVHFLPPGGGERVFRYEGDPGRVELDPRWHQAFLRFVEMGFLHILEGMDHLLFILCLVIPLRRFAGLVPVVTAFTLAHSITLFAAALGMAPSALWFPPLVETLIAASIVWMALENVVGARLSRRWRVAFGFGLIHGFGFSFLLTESLQFAGGHLVTSLLAFNVGVELGQLAVLLVAIPLLNAAFRRVVPERVGVLLLSALVAHQAWHWMTERGAAFLAYDLRLPVLDTGLLVAAMRWTLLLLVCVGAAWGLSGLFGRWAGGVGDPAGERGPA